MTHISRPVDRRDSILELDMDMSSVLARLSTIQPDLAEAELEDYDHEGMANFANSEDYLFDAMSEGSGKVYLSRFVAMLYKVGLRKDDVRLAESMKHLKQAQKKLSAKGKDVGLDRETFKECINPNIVLIKRAFERDFIIPEFDGFCLQMEHIYDACKANTGGNVATYIPQLARFDPNYWGLSICSVDGQRFSLGDTSIPFCLQSTSKSLNYALALSEHGEEYVHKYVGQEPSGVSFNEIKLDPTNKPHNPMINAGAIVTASLLKTTSSMADRFDHVSQAYKRMAGGEFLGFNNSVYLSERDTADRNFALGHYMQENKCFPKEAKLKDTLDFYFQLCSVEVTAESAAVIAATLASGGLCPLTGEQVLSGEAVRNTLGLMASCGMYDYSGQFAFEVGLPAKSGVSGVVILVIPNVVGICLWSPPLDRCGNSCRGIQFCEMLVNKFNFHMYDNLVHTRAKSDPRRKLEKFSNDMFTLLQAASMGEIKTLIRLYLTGVDMKISDYDGRTALHLAAAEGHPECVKLLVQTFGVPLNPKDRWDNTPQDEANTFNHYDIATYLADWIKNHPGQLISENNNIVAVCD